jgi:hypothetical protein
MANNVIESSCRTFIHDIESKVIYTAIWGMIILSILGCDSAVELIYTMSMLLSCFIAGLFFLGSVFVYMRLGGRNPLFGLFAMICSMNIGFLQVIYGLHCIIHIL